MSDPLRNKYILQGVGITAGFIIVAVAVFVLGAVYGPTVFTRLRDIPVNADVKESAAPNIIAVDPEAGKLAQAVMPEAGIELPATWGDLGKQLVKEGVIDRRQIAFLYSERLGFGPQEQKLLDESNNGRLKMTPDNAGFLLNMLWALGLGNKNPILETGPMVDKNYGGAGNFASTGGWTLSKGNAMDHYSKHAFIKLTEDQQALVERISRGIFRPCCDNSVYFPDCNHGMAMLGLLELMASQDVSEADMYKVALQVNSYWFPETYLTLAKYIQTQKNTPWDQADPKEILGAEYSSKSGYRAIRSQTQPVKQGGGSGCGV